MAKGGTDMRETPSAPARAPSEPNGAAGPGEHQVSLPVAGMTCAGCAARVEDRLRRTSGVREASVNLATGRATVTFDPARVEPGRLVEAIRRSGYDSPAERVILALRGVELVSDPTPIERALTVAKELIRERFPEEGIASDLAQSETELRSPFDDERALGEPRINEPRARWAVGSIDHDFDVFGTKTELPLELKRVHWSRRRRVDHLALPSQR